jgi:hypothetical protein
VIAVEERSDFEVGGDRCQSPLGDGGLCGARMVVAGDGKALVCSVFPRTHACRVACSTVVADAVNANDHDFDPRFETAWAAACAAH